MPNSAAMDLFEYWGEFPPVHILVRGYIGYEGTGPKKTTNNPIEIAAAMSMLSGGARAQKLSTAPAVDRERFESLKKQAEAMKTNAG
jgi:hypothetical protein